MVVSVIPALGRWMQEDQEFKTNLSYIESARPGWATTAKPCLKNKIK
jgi:hypothetical protein